MPVYNILTDQMIDANVRFVRLEPQTLAVTLRTVYTSLVDIHWINNFFGNNPVIKESVLARVEPTIEMIESEFKSGAVVSVDAKTGELVVSEISRSYLVDSLSYFDIPIGELFKQKKSGNPGFDFFSVNSADIILFGEAKYAARYTPYKCAVDQVKRFIDEKKDIKDVMELERFIPADTQPMQNLLAGQKGFVAAFSSKNEADNDLITKIMSLPSYTSIKNYPEVICIALNV